MKAENPFATWLSSRPYGRQWVPVGMLGGWIGPASVSAFVREGAEAPVLSSTSWPLQVASAGPSVWISNANGVEERGYDLDPVEMRGDSEFRPLVALFAPWRTPSWLEPVQSFVLYWKAWPERSQAGKVISWLADRDDGEPQLIARWEQAAFDDHTTRGTLEIRRDALFAFMAAFEYDLAIYFSDHTDTGHPDGWRDEGREEDRLWEVWVTDVMTKGPNVASLLSVALLRRPEYEEERQPWAYAEPEPVPYPIGVDPATGEEVTTTYPPGGALTPVFFREEVLEKYYADPSLFEVEESFLRAGRQWNLPFARTGRGTVQVWLCDIAEKAPAVQAHWRQYAIVDDGGVPEWRIRTDLFAQWVEVPREGPILGLLDGIAAVRSASAERFGKPLFAEIDPAHAQAVRVLRVPQNDSLPAFVDQLRTLAILVVDHIDGNALEAAGFPSVDGDGTLARLGRLVGAEAGVDAEAARDRIGPLFAVQSLRSNFAAHRTGSEAQKALERADIDPHALREGFRVLAERVATCLDDLGGLISAGG